MIDREIEQKVKALTKQFPVVAILGPRQSGKTTLTKKVFPKYTYTTLESPDTREFATFDPRGFLESLKGSEGIILDEVQYVPQLFSYIQVAVDEQGLPGKFILTGSQNFLLNEKISQTLAGRVAILTLLPLSLEELIASNKLPSAYERLLFEGFYPRIHAQGISPRDWYPNYIFTYIEKDVRQIKNVTDLILFQRFVKLCAGRIGQIINFSEIGRDAGISYQTAKAWLSLLESSYILFLLQPYYKNFSKRLIKSPKLYFYDTGLACALLNIESEKQLDTHYLKGGLFESFVLSELLKQRFNYGLTPNLYFWRDKLGHEIDCIFEKESSLISIEIKSAKTLSSDFFKELIYWQELTKIPPDKSFLVYGGKEIQKRHVATVLGWDHLPAISKFR